MPTTAQDLIRSALLLNGAVAADQTVSASDLADGLTALNDMLASWSLDNTIVYATTTENLTFIAGHNPYTIGAGGDWNTARPTRILAAQIVDSSGVDHVITPVGYDDYQVIALKGLAGSYPDVLHFDGAYPLGNLFFYPVPQDAWTLRLTSEKPFAGFAAVGDTVTLPPGYMRAIRFNLALELAQYSAALPPKVEEIAREALMLIKHANMRTTTLRNDPALLNERAGRVNIYGNTF